MSPTQDATDVRPTRLDASGRAGTPLVPFVAEHDLALVEFYTEGCSMCAAMEPVLGNVARVLADEYDDAAVGLANPRDHPPLVERFDVRSVPKLLLFRDGELEAAREDGFLGTEEVLACVREHAE